MQQFFFLFLEPVHVWLCLGVDIPRWLYVPGLRGPHAGAPGPRPKALRCFTYCCSDERHIHIHRHTHALSCRHTETLIPTNASDLCMQTQAYMFPLCQALFLTDWIHVADHWSSLHPKMFKLVFNLYYFVTVSNTFLTNGKRLKFQDVIITAWNNRGDVKWQTPVLMAYCLNKSLCTQQQAHTHV